MLAEQLSTAVIPKEILAVVMVTVDNITADALPYLIDGIFSLGAKNVNACTAMTKKGRLGYLLFIDTQPEYLDPIAEFLTRETGTLGVRILESDHRKWEYRMEKVRLQLTPPGREHDPVELWIFVKLVCEGERILSAKAEYRDLEAAVNQLAELGIQVALTELRAEAELGVLKNFLSETDQMKFEIIL
jgi:uncharacterized protein (DUF111 family)